MICGLVEVDLTHPAVLVASELATNAVTHARTVFTVTILPVDSSVRIEVSDRRRDLPAPGPALSGGFGLKLVESLADRWGAELSETGKTVWAEVPV